MVAPSQIDICNRALGRIRSPAISSINDASPQAQQCRIFYQSIVDAMLNGPHDWSFANQRVQMALAGTNDRPYEWLYAYSLPANCASPIRALPDPATCGMAFPIQVPGEPYSETWAFFNSIAVPYEIEDQILYTNAQNAWLDYTINSLDGVVMSALCGRAIEIELAALLAVPLKGDSTREKELLAQSELAWQKAIADDRNRQPQTYGNYEPEAMAVRHYGGGHFVGDFC